MIELRGKFNIAKVFTKNIEKGAISAQKDEKAIIPINMRDESLICLDKGNPD